MNGSDNTPARLSALEAHVDALGTLLAKSTTLLGMLNAHISASVDEGWGQSLWERRDEMQSEIAKLYDEISAIWPEPE